MSKYIHLEPRPNTESNPVQGVEFQELGAYIKELIDHLGVQLTDQIDVLTTTATEQTSTLADQTTVLGAILAQVTSNAISIGRLELQLAAVQQSLAFLVPPTATKAVIQINGENDMETITVDTTGATATLAWEDDKSDADAASPAGVVATFASDTVTVLTINNDTANPLQGDIVAVGEGTANVSVALFAADGVTPLTLADGTTPFPIPDPVAVTVGAGPAASATLTVNS